ncbi:hypothetical protein WJX72_009853 [[Myrmecia] bisecta]|uniref:Agenet domain-containing protein n=1 Tax=[Myrmecia] bisecta TaxID=41462 RepID=A0AAW1QA22_9CHLO
MQESAGVYRRPVFPSAVDWSQDNLLAVATGASAVIFSPADLAGPRAFVAEEDPDWEAADAEAVPRNADSNIHYRLTHMRRNFGAISQQRPAVRSVSWSPPGCTATGGCVLATVTDDHKVRLYAPTSAFAGQWSEVADLSAALRDHLQADNWKAAQPEQADGDDAGTLRLRGGGTSRLPQAAPRAGSRVEIMNDEDGLRDSWYSGVITQIKHKYALVKYDHLLATEAPPTALQEWIKLPGAAVEDAAKLNKAYPSKPDASDVLRPEPPQEFVEKGVPRQVGDAVDAWTDDGWWECEVLSANPQKRTAVVQLPDTSVEVPWDQLRTRMRWDGSAWTLVHESMNAAGKRTAGAAGKAGSSKGKQAISAAGESALDDEPSSASKRRKADGEPSQPDAPAYVVPEDFSAADFPKVDSSSADKLKMSIRIAFMQRVADLREQIPEEERHTYAMGDADDPADRALMERADAEMRAAYGALLAEHGLDAEAQAKRGRAYVRQYILETIKKPTPHPPSVVVPYEVPEGFGADQLPGVDLTSPATCRSTVPAAFLTRFLELRRQLPAAQLPHYQQKGEHMYGADAQLVEQVRAELMAVHGAVLAGHGYDSKWLLSHGRGRLRHSWDPVADQAAEKGEDESEDGDTVESRSDQDHESAEEEAGSEDDDFVSVSSKGKGAGSNAAGASGKAKKAKGRSKEGGAAEKKQHRPTKPEPYKVPEGFDASVFQPLDFSSTKALTKTLQDSFLARWLDLRSEVPAAELPKYQKGQHLSGPDAALAERVIAEMVAAFHEDLQRVGLDEKFVRTEGKRAIRVNVIQTNTKPSKQPAEPKAVDGGLVVVQKRRRASAASHSAVADECAHEGGSDESDDDFQPQLAIQPAAPAPTSARPIKRQFTLPPTNQMGLYARSKTGLPQIPDPQYERRLALTAALQVSWSPTWSMAQPDGSLASFVLLAVGSKAGQIWLWRYRLPAYSLAAASPVSAADFVLLGGVQASSSWPDLRPVASLSMHHQSSAAASGSGSSVLMLAVGKPTGLVEVWTSGRLPTSPAPSLEALQAAISQGQVSAVRGGHSTAHVTGVSWRALDAAAEADAPDGALLLSTGVDGTAKSWRVHGGQVTPYPAPERVGQTRGSCVRPDAAFGGALSSTGSCAAVLFDIPGLEHIKQQSNWAKLHKGHLDIIRLQAGSDPPQLAAVAKAAAAALLQRASTPHLLWDLAAEGSGVAGEADTAGAEGDAAEAEPAEPAEAEERSAADSAAENVAATQAEAAKAVCQSELVQAVLEILEQPFLESLAAHNSDQPASHAAPANASRAAAKQASRGNSKRKAAQDPSETSGVHSDSSTGPGFPACIPMPAWRGLQAATAIRHLLDPNKTVDALQRNELQLLQRHVVANLAAATGDAAPADGSLAHLSLLLMADWVTAHASWPALHQELPPLAAATYAHYQESPPAAGLGTLPSREVWAGKTVGLGSTDLDLPRTAAIDLGGCTIPLPRCGATLRICDTPQAWRCYACLRHYSQALGGLLATTKDAVLLNTCLLRLAELFASGLCTNLLRCAILQAAQRLDVHRDELAINSAMLVKHILLVTSSTDAVARAYALRLLGHFAPQLANHLEVHHKVREAMSSHDRVEVEAAATAGCQLAAVSKLFAATSLPHILGICGAAGTLPETRCRLLPMLRHMGHTSQLAFQAQQGAQQLLQGRTAIGQLDSQAATSLLRAQAGSPFHQQLVVGTCDTDPLVALSCTQALLVSLSRSDHAAQPPTSAQGIVLAACSQLVEAAAAAQPSRMHRRAASQTSLALVEFLTGQEGPTGLGKSAVECLTAGVMALPTGAGDGSPHGLHWLCRQLARCVPALPPAELLSCQHQLLGLLASLGSQGQHDAALLVAPAVLGLLRCQADCGPHSPTQKNRRKTVAQTWQRVSAQLICADGSGAAYWAAYKLAALAAGAGMFDEAERTLGHLCELELADKQWCWLSAQLTWPLPAAFFDTRPRTELRLEPPAKDTHLELRAGQGLSLSWTGRLVNIPVPAGKPALAGVQSQAPAQPLALWTSSLII